MKLVKYVKAGPGLLYKAMMELFRNDPLRMAGATAFFTSFALPPILVIVIQSLGLIFETHKIRQQLHDKLSEIVGHEVIHSTYETLAAFRSIAANRTVTIVGFVFLLFVATTLFKVIKASINQVWKVRTVRKASFLATIQSRINAVIVILVAGVLFAVGIITEGLQAFVGSYIFEFSPIASVYFNSILNYLFSFIIVTAWFAMLFRYLPDARPSWRVAIAGAVVTGLFFSIGRIVLRLLLSYSNMNTIYGTSASVVLLLLFVFYTSLILYYGTAFTKIWSEYTNDPIIPKHYAEFYRLVEVEKDAQVTIKK